MRFVLFLIVLTSFACSVKEPNSIESITDKMESKMVENLKSVSSVGILREASINGIPLPVNRSSVLSEIKRAFEGFNITREKGQQDGPDFPMYLLSTDSVEILYFAMTPEDSLKLTDIQVTSPLIQDEYGLKVGDGFKDIQDKRKGTPKIYTYFSHQHVWVYYDSSNIYYEINGQAYIPDTVDINNFQFTEEQIKDWKIIRLIWRERL